MATIKVPAVPPEAFQREAKISDLVGSQLAHFRHLEAKLPRSQRSGLRAADVVTENDAARYIAYMTAVLHGRRGAKPSPRVAPAPQRGLAIAAAADSGSPPKKRTTKKPGGKPAARRSGGSKKSPS